MKKEYKTACIRIHKVDLGNVMQQASLGDGGKGTPGATGQAKMLPDSDVEDFAGSEDNTLSE